MRRWIAALALLALGPLAAAGAVSAEVEVVAVKVTEAPKIDGQPDKVWDRVRATKVTASEGPQGDVEISLKAVYTDKEIFFLFQWKDATLSQNRLYEYTGTEWKKLRGNEDHFNLMWDIGSKAKEFPAKGCTAMCHKQGKEVALRTNGPEERMDIWHWKAQRTHPADYADDQWLGHEMTQEGDERVARHGDPKTGGGYAANWDKEAKRPKYGFKEGVKPGPVLMKKDAVEIKDAAAFKRGDRLPREVVEKHAGSRGDIEAGAEWKNGRWTLELKRARETGDKEHDVQFTGPGPYYFGISVHDDEGDEEHSHTGRTALKLMLK